MSVERIAYSVIDNGENGHVGRNLCVCPSKPPDLFFTRTSRNGSELPFVSIVDLLFGWMVLRCIWNFSSSSLPWDQTTMVVSVYLYH